MAYTAYLVPAYIVMAYIVMAYTGLDHTVMAYEVMAEIVIAHTGARRAVPQPPRPGAGQGAVHARGDGGAAGHAGLHRQQPRRLLPVRDIGLAITT